MAPFIGPQPPTAAQMTAAATAAPGLSKLASAAAAVVAGVPLDAAEMAAVLKASRKEGQVKPTRTNWSTGENLQTREILRMVQAEALEVAVTEEPECEPKNL